VSQGSEVGRPSVLEAEMDSGSARVSGYVVPVIAGEVELPA
jgi:predicted PhzF superfamily epimerase YddE/YHI9